MRQPTPFRDPAKYTGGATPPPSGADAGKAEKYKNPAPSDNFPRGVNGVNEGQAWFTSSDQSSKKSPDYVG